jgi:hypothetical protein
VKDLALRVHPGRWAACRLPADSPIPEPAPGATLWSATRTGRETSLIVPEDQVPAGARVESGYAALEVEGTLDFALTGILAGLATTLAEAGVSLLAISTFDTDWLLVRHDRLDDTVTALEAAGHRVSRGDTQRE